MLICLIYNIPLFAQYFPESFSSLVVYGKNTEGDLFDLAVLFIERSCLLIDSVS